MKSFAAVILCMSVIAGMGQTVAFASQGIPQSPAIEKRKDINYSDLLELQDVKYFIGKAEEFRSQQQSATLEQINSFLKKEMKRYYRQKIELSSTMDYPIPGNESALNQLEKDLYNSNPYYGLLSLECGRMALDETDVRYTDDAQRGGNGDAFRHAFWNAMMVNTTTKEWAEKWATAHEDGDLTNDYLNRTMDLSNNYRGREIGLANLTSKSYFKTYLAPKVVQSIDAGKMIRIVSYQLVATDSSGKR